MKKMAENAEPNETARRRLIAADLGNTAMKFGLFHAPATLAAKGDCASSKIPYPYSLTDVRETDERFLTLETWLGTILRHEGGLPGRADGERFHWGIASVAHERTAMLLDWLRTNRPNDSVTQIEGGDVPLEVDYAPKTSLGVDRRLAALAATTFFPNSGSALIVDIGTAAKIDRVERGRFVGGAILPGPSTQARSLCEKTDRLPEIDWQKKSAPFFYPATATESAIRTGIFGGILGAILFFYRETLRQTGDDFLPILLTGGGATGLELPLESLLAEELALRTGRKPPRIVRTSRDAVLTGIALSLLRKN